ncbi:MAG TPA: pseudouridine-5'-phosphate glycosidase [Blastocatellia bacterium]|nr:pseudouridine-5'-phosphate glycosidase [Blastocatellia bacterium]
MNQVKLRISDHVERALADGAPVVALESTVIAHGLPYPLNLETALACEETIRSNGATAATLGIVDGIPTIGLNEDEISIFATGKTRDGRAIDKLSLNNLASVMVSGGWGATTVASSLKLAHAAGIRVFSTGGIGGVHRGAAASFDISADLTALGNTPMICVSAGAKAILDLPKTIEYLETLGVPVIGYCTRELPAFYSRRSGIALDLSVERHEDAVAIALRHWDMNSATAVLVCVPIPAEFEIPVQEIDAAIEQAIAKAAREAIHGKAVTPFLLSELTNLTDGRSLEANRALLVNNAEAAARMAACFSRP